MLELSDERTALNEAVCKRLGWTKIPGDWTSPIWESSDRAGGIVATPDFTSDWNAVYRWIVPAVKEMGKHAEARLDEYFFDAVFDRHGVVQADFLYATPEDYCRAFLAVTEVNDAR
ncbi:MAG: hypothetical protein WC211_03875 [Dehalococcoidia bacterium]